MDAAAGPSVPDDPDPERACGGVHADQSSGVVAGRRGAHGARRARAGALRATWQNVRVGPIWSAAYRLAGVGPRFGFGKVVP
ncbi:Uncharacterised protein [Mycobacteroides abscessus]|nr:Uncharacterised protein [Mycobacteroides abscessus]